MEMGGVADTVGSQFLITLGDDNGLADTGEFSSIVRVRELPLY